MVKIGGQSEKTFVPGESIDTSSATKKWSIKREPKGSILKNRDAGSLEPFVTAVQPSEPEGPRQTHSRSGSGPRTESLKQKSPKTRETATDVPAREGRRSTAPEINVANPTIIELHKLCLKKYNDNSEKEEELFSHNILHIQESLTSQLELNFQSVFRDRMTEITKKNEGANTKALALALYDQRRAQLMKPKKEEDSIPEVRVELQTYPPGSSRRKKGCKPILITASNRFVVERAGWPQLASIKDDDGKSQYVKADVEDNKGFSIRFIEFAKSPEQKFDINEKTEETTIEAQKNIIQKLLYEQTHTCTEEKLNSEDEKIEEMGQDISDIMQSIRQIIRMNMKKGYMSAAELLESCIKGLVIQFFDLLKEAYEKIQQLNKTLQLYCEEKEKAQQDKMELITLRRSEGERTTMIRESNKKVQSERQSFKDHIQQLKDEIMRLTPIGSDLDNVTSLMDEFNFVIMQMEEESNQQKQIIQDVGTITRSMVQEKNEDPMSIHDPSRIVRLKNGEIQLRSFDTENFNSQVTEADLLLQDGPLLLRLPIFRYHMHLGIAATKHMKIRITKLTSLSAVERQCDAIFTYAARISHTQLFGQQHFASIALMSYLDSGGVSNVYQAYAKLYRFYEGLFNFLHTQNGREQKSTTKLKLNSSVRGTATASSRESETLPDLSAKDHRVDHPKVRLLARLIEFCPLQESLPSPLHFHLINLYQVLEKQKRPLHGTGAYLIPLQTFYVEVLARIIRFEPSFKYLMTNMEKHARRDDVTHHVTDQPIPEKPGDMLLSLIQGALHSDRASKLSSIIGLAEDKEDIPEEDVREAMLQAMDGFHIDWKPLLLVVEGNIEARSIVEKLGVLAPRPKYSISLFSAMEITAEALLTDIKSDCRPFQQMWMSKEPKTIPQMMQVLTAFDSTINAQQAHLFLFHVTQYSHSLGVSGTVNDIIPGEFEDKTSYGGLCVNHGLALVSLIRSGLCGIKDMESDDFKEAAIGGRQGHKSTVLQKPQTLPRTTVNAKQSVATAGAAQENSGGTKVDRRTVNASNVKGKKK